MKTKLLRKLRKRGRQQIHIISVTTDEFDIVIGMSISYSDSAYSHLFFYGLTEEDVMKAAERIYINKYIMKNAVSVSS